METARPTLVISETDSSGVIDRLTEAYKNTFNFITLNAANIHQELEIPEGVELLLFDEFEKAPEFLYSYLGKLVDSGTYLIVVVSAGAPERAPKELLERFMIVGANVR